MKRLLHAILLTLLLTGFQPAALANVSISSNSPTERQINFLLKEGESQTGAVVIENLDTQDANINLYGADGTVSNMGTFAITTKSAVQQTIGKWVTFATPNLTLKGKERKEVSFTLNIPKDATPGTYGGGIAAETSANGNGSAGGGNAVSVSSRVVVKLYVSIPGVKKTSFEWNDFSYTPIDGSKTPFFNLSYKNTGNTIVNIEQKIDVQGFPGITQNISLPMASLPQGSNIDIPVRWEEQPVFGFLTATATITFSEYDIINNKNIDGQTQTKTVKIVIIHPAILLAGEIVGGLLILLILILLVRSLLRHHLVKISKPYTVQPKETLEEIADRSGISWKKLARINKLKPPYNLKAGSGIKVPPSRRK